MPDINFFFHYVVIVNNCIFPIFVQWEISDMTCQWCSSTEIAIWINSYSIQTWSWRHHSLTSSKTYQNFTDSEQFADNLGVDEISLKQHWYYIRLLYHTTDGYYYSTYIQPSEDAPRNLQYCVLKDIRIHCHMVIE